MAKVWDAKKRRYVETEKKATIDTEGTRQARRENVYGSLRDAWNSTVDTVRKAFGDSGSSKSSGNSNAGKTYAGHKLAGKNKQTSEENRARSEANRVKVHGTSTSVDSVYPKQATHQRDRTPKGTMRIGSTDANKRRDNAEKRLAPQERSASNVSRSTRPASSATNIRTPDAKAAKTIDYLTKNNAKSIDFGMGSSQTSGGRTVVTKAKPKAEPRKETKKSGASGTATVSRTSNKSINLNALRSANLDFGMGSSETSKGKTINTTNKKKKKG